MRYVHRDHLGSVKQISRASDGVKLDQRDYRPFGKPHTQTNATLTTETKGHIGERYDDTPELMYLNARYMDPELGVFISPDWWEVTRAGVGTNRYSYSFNDPVNIRDNSGNEAITVTGAIVIGGIAIAGAWSIDNLVDLTDNGKLDGSQGLGLTNAVVGTLQNAVDNLRSSNSDAEIVKSTGSNILDEVLGGLGGTTRLPGGKSSVPNFEAPGADIESVLEGLRGQGIELESKGNGVYVGELPDGTRVVVRPGSKTDGRPTVEVQSPKQSGGMKKSSETRLGETDSDEDEEQSEEN